MKTSEILDRAADVIERNGWVQDQAAIPTKGRRPADWPCCTLGAIRIALFGAPDDGGLADPEVDALMLHLGLEPQWELGDEHPVARWNDAPGRTAEQVIAALRAAAASERSEGR